MNISWDAFTPYSSLAGGLVIGLASALYLLGNGRIAGIAGIVSNALNSILERRGLGTEKIRLLFLAGMLASPFVWLLFAALPQATVTASRWELIVAGLLVGIGVRMSNGCTSGHGICGLARFSLRSLVNVLSFMGAGLVTVYVIRHVI